MKSFSFLFFLTSFFHISIFSFRTEAQQHENINEEYKYSAALTAEKPFNLSVSSIPEWMNCEVVRSERVFELCFQKSAAEAAVKSAEILYWQAWTGVFTLLAAVAAAIFSGFAARQASKGVAVALKVGMAEVRPYISTTISLDKNEEHSQSVIRDKVYEASYSIKNIGKSEAFICDMRLKLDGVEQAKEFVEDIFEFDLKKKFEDTPTFNILNDMLGDNQYLHPNQEPTIIGIPITNKMIDDVINKKFDFIFSFAVEYKDPLGTKYRSSYAYRARFRKLNTGVWPYELVKHSPIKFQQDLILEDPKIGIGGR